jgi:hypothetical protein
MRVLSPSRSSLSRGAWCRGTSSEKDPFVGLVVEAGFAVLQRSARSASASLVAFHTTLSTRRSCRRSATFRPKVLTIKHAHCVGPSTRVAPIRRAARIGSVEAPLSSSISNMPLHLRSHFPLLPRLRWAQNALFLNHAFLSQRVLRGTVKPLTSRSSMGVDENEA